MNRKSLYLQTNGKIMVETEQYKELSRVPRTLSEPNNGASLDLLIESGGTIMHDIIIFAANTQMKDLFGDMWFSIEDFCTVMGYDRTKLQRKLTEEQKAKTFGQLTPVYKTEYEGEQIEHPIETFFESALFSLGKNTLSVGYTVNGVTKFKFIPILESFDIKDNFGTKKRTKRLYKVNLSKDLKNMMFTGYNLIDLKDYRCLPNKRAYRKFYLNLSKMILLIKHKIQQGQEPEFTLTVDELAKHFDINIANNHDRKKKVIATLNAINKNLTQTKFEYEFVKKENEKWAYSVKFRFSEETLKYFDEKAKAIITAKYYEGLKDAFLRKKGVQVYETYKYKDCFIFGSGSFNEEFTEWAYSDADMEIKNEIYRNTYIHVLKMPPKENCIVNMADIRPF